MDYRAQEFANILDKWNEYRKIELFCDGVIVSKDEKTYKIHRALLATNSDYFRVAFSTQLSENTSVVKLDYLSSIVDCIVDVIYTRTCNITVQNVKELLPAAKLLGINSLIELCCEFLKEKTCLDNVYGIFRFAAFYCCDALAEHAWHVMLNRFESFIKQSSEFQEMLIDDLVHLLSNPSLNIPSETVAFRAMCEWINANPVEEWLNADRVERVTHANLLWKCLRFGLIEPRFFRTEDDALDPSSMPRLPYEVVFAVGGWSRGSPTNCMECYDIRADKWFKLNCEDEIPRAYHGLVSVDNLLYMIGGFDGTNHFNSVRCFNPSTKQWSEKACMHRQRCYTSCVVVNKDIYAIGGFNTSHRMRSVERYSVADNQWKFAPPMHGRRSDCAAVVVGNKIYVAGGFNGQEVLDTVECYDMEEETWHRLPNLNTRRSGLSLVLYREWIYAIGGFNGRARLNSVERLSTQTPTQWLMDVPSMITQRSNFGSIVLEDKVFVMGGFNGLSTVRFCECFDGERWTEITGMNRNRSALSVSVCKGLKNTIDYTPRLQQ